MIAIRPGLPAEHAALLALLRRAALANSEHRADLLANPDALELPAAQVAAGDVLVAERDGALLGFAALAWRADGDCELDGLFVEPAHWRHGVGSTLVEHAAQCAGLRGAAALHVVAGEAAEGFYAACGFVRTGAAVTRFGPALAMRRSLSG